MNAVAAAASAAAPPTIPARQQCEGLPLLVCVRGTLLAPAHVHMPGAPGREVVLLDVWLQQQVAHHPHALPLFAAWHMPDVGGLAHTVQWAQQLASRMTAGAEVLVLGTGLETGTRGGQPVLRVIRPINVKLVSVYEREQQQQEQAHHV